MELTSKEIKHFWEKVEKTPECWLWKGASSANRYGKVGIQGKGLLAHRLSFELAYGPVPDGMYVLHQCNNPSCVNPQHLYAGTPQDNMDDKVEAGHHLNMPIGTKVKTAKLTASQVMAIRERYSANSLSLRELAQEYGVSHETINLIVSRKTWKHL